ncbi:MAG: thioredoxin [Chitinophagaceae bacterium]
MKTLSEMIQSDKPVLVDFSAEWCGPCQLMAPVLKELKDDVKEDVTILKVDIDKNPQAARLYNVMSVPTLVIFQNGNIKWRQSGVVGARELQQVLSQFKLS